MKIVDFLLKFVSSCSDYWPAPGPSEIIPSVINSMAMMLQQLVPLFLIVLSRTSNTFVKALPKLVPPLLLGFRPQHSSTALYFLTMNGSARQFV